ncbi:hypothetical protein [Chamaesiphon sp.]|uniref:hypothetical protein n=1 Tax=Chamaesiphon sp. TaxID=2814140 RepID=UPI003594816E
MSAKSKLSAVQKNNNRKFPSLEGDRIYTVTLQSQVVNSKVRCLVVKQDTQSSVSLNFRLYEDNAKLYAEAEVPPDVLLLNSWLRDINTISPLVCRAVMAASNIIIAS